MDSELIYQQLLQHNISVAPSNLFNITNQQNHFIRINCSFEMNEKIQNALDKLIEIVKININQ